MIKSIKAWVKRTPVAFAVYRKVGWHLHVARDQFVTRYWKRTRNVKTPFGFTLISGVHPAYHQMRLGIFEPEETTAILKQLNRSDVFVDVGANLGYYTLIACKQGKTTVAVEPQLHNLTCLYANLLANDFDNSVEIFPLALAETPGILTLYGASGPSASLVKDWAGYSSKFGQLVATSTLDNILGGRFDGRRLLIKIDVEGAEFGVLKGATTTLARQPKPAWLVEICLNEYHPTGNQDFVETFEIFWSHGYSSYLPNGTEVTRADIAKWVHAGRTDGNFNYVFE